MGTNSPSVDASWTYIHAALKKTRGGGRKAWNKGEDESGWSRALIRNRRGATPRPTPIWLVMQTRRTQGRQNRAESRYPLFISLRGREEGYIPSLTRILRPNKDPHAEICMGTTTRTFYARTFTPGGSGGPSVDEDRIRAA